jgi:hypothetical protein
LSFDVLLTLLDHHSFPGSFAGKENVGDAVTEETQVNSNGYLVDKA